MANILDAASDILRAHLNVSSVLRKLNDRHLLSREETASIVRNRDDEIQVQMLLAILKTKGVQGYDEFMTALRKLDHDLYIEVKKIQMWYQGIH